jgi:hypothetical protein
MSIDAVKSHSAADAEPASPAPRRWWQWFLVYPAVAVALVSAIPTYIELFNSSKFDVPFGQSSLAKQQNDLWERNLTCSAAPLDPFVNEYNVEVDAIICKSGDVLVRVRTPNKKTFYRWVPVDAFPIRSASLSVVAGLMRHKLLLSTSPRVRRERVAASLWSVSASTREGSYGF